MSAYIASRPGKRRRLLTKSKARLIALSTPPATGRPGYKGVSETRVCYKHEAEELTTGIAIRGWRLVSTNGLRLGGA